MASNITLSAGVRSNLLNLQTTAGLKDITQTRLSTGKKVNSALDNPTNFFTAAGLTSRSNDLTALLDGISNGIQTLKAADNGITSITTSIESLQATVRQARQDKSYLTSSASIVPPTTVAGTEKLSFAGGSVGTTAVDVSLVNKQIVGTGGSVGTGKGGAVDITIGTVTKTVTLADGDTVDQQIGKINTAFGKSVASNINGGVALVDTTNTAVTVADGTGNTAGTTAALFGATPTAVSVFKTADQMADAINSTTALQNKVRASNDNGKLRIENDSTLDLTTTGYNASTGSFDGGTGTITTGGNQVRKDLVTQFNEVRDQLNKLADDASFNGVNLLRGDTLKLTFNETSTSSITIQSKDPTGINTTSLGITSATNEEFGSDSSLDSRLDQLSQALSTLRSQSSAFGSKLSIVQNRQDFTKALTNTLQTGADNLTLADTNEEGANLLALNTRQQLQTTSLSFASQADQAVLQFLR
jgi:flagellin